MYLIYLLTARDALGLVARLPQLDVGEGLGQLALHLLEIRCFMLIYMDYGMICIFSGSSFKIIGR